MKLAVFRGITLAAENYDSAIFFKKYSFLISDHSFNLLFQSKFH